MTILESLRRHQVVAVLRAPDHASAMRGVAAVVAGGVRAIEVTYSTPQAARVIRDLRAEHADIVVGAGTVTTATQVAESVAAGAEFLVCPGTAPAVASAMRESGTPYLLGALTPTEVMTAVDLGAEIVKLFPGSLGGPGYLRTLRGPFPVVPLMPTGGVSIGNARAWLDAGAVCLGAGSELASRDLLAAGDDAEITRRARAFMAAVESRSPA